MKPYRIVVVDDSAFMRKIVSDLIEEDTDLKVEATAVHGKEAIELVKELQPDLVTMDIEMPIMNGLEALSAIMQDKPLPVIMLSGINEQGMRETIMALELGAFDFIRKPSAATTSQGIEQVGQALREQIMAAMQMKERREAREAAERAAALLPQRRYSHRRLDPHPAANAPNRTHSPNEIPAAPLELKNPLLMPLSRASDVSPSEAEGSYNQTLVPENTHRSQNTKDKKEKLAQSKPTAASEIVELRSRNKLAHAGTKEVQTSRSIQPARKQGLRTEFNELVAIGCSTGGPKALKAVLEQIPSDFPAPIVIVQHMPPNFTHSLAQRLNSLSPLQVVEAEEGMVIEKGTAYIAPGGFHMIIHQVPAGECLIHLNKEELRNGHRPSVDVMFESLLPITSIKHHAVLMTGMGSDGAKAMKKLHDAGVTSTLAESEETCVVYGMPRSAVELDCVNEVVPLYEIASKLVKIVK
ncbi:two-component system chemotaxis response regulator CheB [Paenibacillus shirakamiensis]|uniref:Protein-glutamate methylesterase/protein-glutamine glutaminase n=1 Tax=Paenibacillus shirakamiensis TaxID=1265935 RepID=A0ABS4JH99_9BACL|nr:chemotaxis response regulator protein-glutamate methylesterase [Paenibacillus shirakamiensis]MBP2001099.1 two-component system chemotaxis response regulator CheB [Paenibacillus shirakamiensis]